MSMFWTDATQAAERLNGTFVLFGDDPVFIERVEPSEERRDDAVARCRLYDPKERTFKVNLSDPKFHKFRLLPPKGWVNSERNACAVYLERRPVRSRTHGLNGANMSVAFVRQDGAVAWRDIAFEDIAREATYAAAAKGIFPKFGEVFEVIRNGSAIAVSSKFALQRDTTSLRWLYKDTDRVGLVPDPDTVLLVDKYRYLREEIMAAEALPLRNIKEL